jgi:hypothetical protein
MNNFLNKYGIYVSKMGESMGFMLSKMGDFKQGGLAVKNKEGTLIRIPSI